MDNLDVNLDDIAEVGVLGVPPWTLNSPKYLFDLCTETKANTDSSIFTSKFNEIREKYSSFQSIYTDAVAAAASTMQRRTAPKRKKAVTDASRKGISRICVTTIQTTYRPQ